VQSAASDEPTATETVPVLCRLILVAFVISYISTSRCTTVLSSAYNHVYTVMLSYCGMLTAAVAATVCVT
jgi:hypothetical protein